MNVRIETKQNDERIRAMFLTDETMQEMDYELAQYRAIDGIDQVERFVSESDYDRVTECDHFYGFWTDEFSAYDMRSTFECTECGYVREV